MVALVAVRLAVLTDVLACSVPVITLDFTVALVAVRLAVLTAASACIVLAETCWPANIFVPTFKLVPTVKLVPTEAELESVVIPET